MRTSTKILLLLLACSFSTVSAQNTVGLLNVDGNRAHDGYNLIYPHNQPTSYLLDNCGRVVHSWPDSAQYRPGNTSYLLANGNLAKTKRQANSPTNDPIWAGGGGAIVEIRDWDNNLLWQFEQNSAEKRLHHDIAPMPNGNILMISWEVKTKAEAIAMGRNPELLENWDAIWPDYILEVDPSTDEVVWEWHAWDHLIQDFDPEKANFGEVAAHPELIDLNYQTNDGHPDWLHVNAIDYNPELDQILISVPTFSEVWVIDHSTTTEEAAGHTGGNAGKGGDLLYRWGNPLAYRQGAAADQKLFYPHDLHWVTTPGYEGQLAVFNNRVAPTYSTVNLFTPPFNSTTSDYDYNGGAYGPEQFDRTVVHPDTLPLSSSGLSSVQVLPNDNLLICSGRNGYSFEITPDNEVVWEYRTPLIAGQPAVQGASLGLNDNLTFRIKRYDTNYPAFEGKDLSPKGYIELEPNSGFCGNIVSVMPQPAPPATIKVYPNPTSGWANIEAERACTAFLLNSMGQLVQTLYLKKGQQQVSLEQHPAGLYWLETQKGKPQKIILTR